MLIFELSQEGRQATAQAPKKAPLSQDIPTQFLRENPPRLPACSELQVVRHYTGLSQKNFSIDTNMYPLGSCTMKYTPRGVHKAASINGFLNRHPLAQAQNSQGFLEVLYRLQESIRTKRMGSDPCFLRISDDVLSERLQNPQQEPWRVSGNGLRKGRSWY